MPNQAASEILMVRPASFGFDHTTAASNAFQSKEGAEDLGKISESAIVEFDRAVDRLRSNGITVHVIQDSKSPVKPNAVFPNNWTSFHDDQVILYPMLAENRRWERRQDILDQLRREGLAINEITDLSYFEKKGQYLESTGSMVLDYENELVYACLSSRTSMEVLEEFCKTVDFDAITFDAFDNDGLSVYHTNVMMCIAARYAVICAESIPSEQRNTILEALEKTGHELILLSMDQMYAFAGNMMEVLDTDQNSVLVMSSTALASLSSDQKGALSQYSRLLDLEIPIIEKYGGGSVRCMMCRLR